MVRNQIILDQCFGGWWIEKHGMVSCEGWGKMQLPQMESLTKADLLWDLVHHLKREGITFPGNVLFPLSFLASRIRQKRPRLVADGQQQLKQEDVEPGLTRNHSRWSGWHLKTESRQMGHLFSLQSYNFLLPKRNCSRWNFPCKSWHQDECFWQVAVRTIQLFFSYSSGRIYTHIYFHGLLFDQYIVIVWNLVEIKFFVPAVCCLLASSRKSPQVMPTCRPLTRCTSHVLSCELLNFPNCISRIFQLLHACSRTLSAIAAVGSCLRIKFHDQHNLI